MTERFKIQEGAIYDTEKEKYYVFEKKILELLNEQQSTIDHAVSLISTQQNTIIELQQQIQKLEDKNRKLIHHLNQPPKE